MSYDREIAWIDSETTGVKRGVHRIIEIAVMVTDPDLNVIEQFESKVRVSPADLKLATPEALKINGYSEQSWKDAPDPRFVFPRAKRMIGRRMTAGQNIVNFDLPMLHAELGMLGEEFVPTKRYLDTMPLCIMLMHHLDIRHPATKRATAGLEFVYDAVGGPELPRHRAMADIHRAQYVYKMFREMIGKAVPKTKGPKR